MNIKKETRRMLVEERRLRNSLTAEKTRLVGQVAGILEFLNLRQLFPGELDLKSITPEMLKKIRTQNIDNKAQWIKEQNVLMNGLDARLSYLRARKGKLRESLLEQEKRNYEEIKKVRS
jgi:DNA mismatch repair ATPase MutS